MPLDFRALRVEPRRLARILAVLAIAMAAGHLVQSLAGKRGAQMSKAGPVVATAAAPVKVVTLSAGAVPELPALPAMPTFPTAMPLLVLTDPQPMPAPVATVVDCTIGLGLTPQPGAMIGLSLHAPCLPDARVVLRHAGLAVTAQTDARGALTTQLPAFMVQAQVEVMFADGSKADAAITIPDAAQMKRFAVQWQDKDAFAIHAFDGDAAYGDAGDVTAANPGAVPVPGLPVAGGFMTVLGDARVAVPLLAQVYTFPLRPLNVPVVVVEAEVTPATCGRELLGETLTSSAGQVAVMDLSVVMPDCGAIGDFLVLKNLVPDTKIAAN